MSATQEPLEHPITEAEEQKNVSLRSRLALACRFIGRHLAVPVLLLVSGLLNFWHLSINGYANTFYTAAVRSMSQNWHNFFYLSFDKYGVMSIDKTPLTYWVQALSVRLFGFHPLSYLAPQAIYGMLTVVLVYDIVRLYWGKIAGFVAGLCLALTPIAVAMSRHNNPDALVILCAVAAVWCAVRGLGKQRSSWILLAGVFVGLGFESKMGVALMVVPAIALGWFYVAHQGRIKAALQLLAAGAIAGAISVAWPLYVVLTPASHRPWLSSTTNNSIWSLIIGYNGVGRIAGQAGGPPADTLANVSLKSPPLFPKIIHHHIYDKFFVHTPQTPKPVTDIFGGTPGLLRLLDHNLGGQAGWLIGLAVVGILGTLFVTQLRPSNHLTGWLIIAGLSFLTSAAVFSVAKGILHPYYVSFLAPFVAILVGAFVGLSFIRKWPVKIIIILGIVLAVIVELDIRHNVSTLPWLPTILVASGAAAIILIIVSWRFLPTLGALVVSSALLVAPAAWSIDTLGHATDSTFPAGGPQSQQGSPSLPPPKTSKQHGPRLGTFYQSEFDYIKKNGGGVLAVSSQTGAALAVIHDKPIVAIGGWSGQESQVSFSWFSYEIAHHDIRWVDTWGARSKYKSGRIGDHKIMQAVEQICPLTTYTNPARHHERTLYDCRGYARAFAGA